MSTPNTIRKLEQQRQVIIDKLLETQTMIRGCFGITYRRCGNPNCWCAEQDAAGHPMNRVTWSDKGKLRSRTVSDLDVDWTRDMAAHYKRFRKNRQALRAIEKKLHLALDKYEAKVIDKTERKQGYKK